MTNDDTDTIWVCAACGQASCWAGIFMCWDSKSANIKKITKAQARMAALEHEDYIQLPEVQAQ